MVDQIERGEKTKEDFQKQISLSLRMQETAEEAEKDYKKFIQITNDKWRTFQQEWDRIFINVGLNEQSRVFCILKDLDQLFEADDSAIGKDISGRRVRKLGGQGNGSSEATD